MCKIIQSGGIDVTFLPAGGVRLIDEVSYVIPALDVKITIRPGFESDGASVPRLFWRVIGHPYSPDYLPAALLHDALYASELLPRAKCDAIFRDYLAQLRVSRWKRNAMYYAVRLGGSAVWRKHTAKSVSDARRLVSAG